MSNYSTLVDWAKTQTEDRLGSVLQILDIPANESNHDAPDQYGGVALLALRATRPETHLRFLVREVVDQMPEGPAKDFANHQIFIANAWYHYSGLKYSPVFHPGQPAIPNLYAVPDHADPSDPQANPGYQTVQAITNALNALQDPVTGQSFPHV